MGREGLLDQTRKRDEEYDPEIFSCCDLVMLTDSSREPHLPDVVIVATEPKHRSGGVVQTALGRCVMLVDYVRSVPKKK